MLIFCLCMPQPTLVACWGVPASETNTPTTNMCILLYYPPKYLLPSASTAILPNLSWTFRVEFKSYFCCIAHNFPLRIGKHGYLPREMEEEKKFWNHDKISPPGVAVTSSLWSGLMFLHSNNAFVLRAQNQGRAAFWDVTSTFCYKGRHLGGASPSRHHLFV